MNKTIRGKLTDQELAYIAGIIDGEGHLGISKNTTKRQRQKSPKYQSEVCVINTDKRLMDWMEQRVGGLVNARTSKSSLNPKWKISYRWRIQEGRHQDFLRSILPYLVIKKRQAELIIEYWNKKTRSYRQGKQWTISLEELEMREYYNQELKKLNARGNREHPQRLNETTSLPKDDAIVRTT